MYLLKTKLMNKFIFIIILFVFGLKAQDNQQSEVEDLDLKLLEYKVRHKIDSIRLANRINQLENDSILYLAAKHHSDYMVKNSKLTHKEARSDFRNSWDRVEYYKGAYNRIGENVLQTNYNKIVLHNGKKYKTNSIDKLANLMVKLWVDSQGHLNNIKNKEFTHTALAISADKNNDEVYACQVFAGDMHQNYKAKNSKEFFPYD